MPDPRPSWPARLRSRLARLRTAADAWAVPTPDGLPRASVLFAFPLLLLILFGVFGAGLAINGSSSGAYRASLQSGHDPALLVGEPQLIRSDEWSVSVPWTIGQVQQGLPETNRSFPGGMDAAIPQDLPRWDWSIAFRPHLLGYLFLDLDRASAWKWWIPGLVMMALASMFLVTVLPRRPLTAALLSAGFFLSPFFQWWFQSVSFWPTAWALAVMTTVIWAVKSSSRAARWGWAAASGYLTVVMAMGIYAPFIIPVVVVAALFAVGVIVRSLRDGAGWRSLLRLLPLVIAGATAGVITLIWLRIEQRTVDAFLSTAYPGDRLIGTGSSGPLFAAQTISSPFSEALVNSAGFLGTNSSEASTFFLVGAFLAPVVVWTIVMRRRAGQRAPWELIGLSLAFLLFLAYAFVPGWDAIAHLLFLDRSSPGRMRIGMGLAAFAIVPYVLREVAGLGRPGRVTSLLGPLVFALVELGIAGAVVLHFGPERLVTGTPLVFPLIALSGLCLWLLGRGHGAAGALTFFLVNAICVVAVNPVYLGVYDMRTTAPAHAIAAIEKASPGNWIGVGTNLPSALLIEEGVVAYNGTQGAPSRVMWKQVDPTSTYEYQWNRLARIQWVSEPGEPVLTNPAPDVIQGTFDACSDFAQKHVDYVLADRPLPSACATRISTEKLPRGARLSIYQVVAPASRP